MERTALCARPAYKLVNAAHHPHITRKPGAPPSPAKCGHPPNAVDENRSGIPFFHISDDSTSAPHIWGRLFLDFWAVSGFGSRVLHTGGGFSTETTYLSTVQGKGRGFVLFFTTCIWGYLWVNCLDRLAFSINSMLFPTRWPRPPHRAESPLHPDRRPRPPLFHRSPFQPAPVLYMRPASS